ncbi:MAG: adenylate/guanylate cyclase domain-containing protein, partial [Flavobacteriales bacterium]|nr:adenylate/guanylate cyclase domain-containing protein [Flavobacteriales bacterium]
RIAAKYGLEKIKTIGDSYMCVCGLPIVTADHAYKTVVAALEMQEFIENRRLEREKKGQTFFEMRCGIHSGPVVAGVVGVNKFQYDIWGDTVNLASRMESSGEVGQVNISETTYNLVKDKITCTYRGEVKAKNKGMINMYFAEAVIEA